MYAPSLSWSDTEVSVKAPTFGSNLDYHTAIKKADDSLSNKVSFHNNQGQPQGE